MEKRRSQERHPSKDEQRSQQRSHWKRLKSGLCVSQKSKESSVSRRGSKLCAMLSGCVTCRQTCVHWRPWQPWQGGFRVMGTEWGDWRNACHTLPGWAIRPKLCWSQNTRCSTKFSKYFFLNYVAHRKYMCAHTHTHTRCEAFVATYIAHKSWNAMKEHPNNQQ